MDPVLLIVLIVPSLVIIAWLAVRRNRRQLETIAETAGLSFQWNGWSSPWSMERELDQGTIRVEMIQRKANKSPYTTVAFSLTPGTPLPEGLGLLQSWQVFNMMRGQVDFSGLAIPADMNPMPGESIGLEVETLEIENRATLNAWLDSREGRREALNQVIVAGSHSAALFNLLTPKEIRHEIRDNAPRAMVYLTLISSLEDLAATLD